MNDGGVYVILLRLSAPVTCEVGALGRFLFPAGWYAYTGSAKRGLRKRIERHWRSSKTRRWHFDFLTTARGVVPIGAVIVRDGELTECELNRRVERAMGAGPGSVVPGFGAGDCRAGCPTHLWFSAGPVSLLEIARVHPGTVAIVPGSDREWEAVQGDRG